MLNFKKSLLLGGASFVFAAAAILVLGKGVASAQFVTEPTQQAEQEQPAEQKQEQATEQNTNSFSYVAQPGDSYSLMARKAIQTYGIINKVDLTQEQIIFAETNLTQDAGSPTLLKGQKVEIKESAIKEVISKAKKLTSQQQSAWSVYAKRANFNTDHVGQAPQVK